MPLKDVQQVNPDASSAKPWYLSSAESQNPNEPPEELLSVKRLSIDNLPPSKNDPALIPQTLKQSLHEPTNDQRVEHFRYGELPGEIQREIIHHFVTAKTTKFEARVRKSSMNKFRQVCLTSSADTRVFEIELRYHPRLRRLFVSNQFLCEAVKLFAKARPIEIKSARFKVLNSAVNEDAPVTLLNRLFAQLITHARVLETRVSFLIPQELDSFKLLSMATDLREIIIHDWQLQKLVRSKEASSTMLVPLLNPPLAGYSGFRPLTKKQFLNLKDRLIFPSNLEDIVSRHFRMFSCLSYWKSALTNDSSFNPRVRYHLTMCFLVRYEEAGGKVAFGETVLDRPKVWIADVVIDLLSSRLTYVHVEPLTRSMIC